VGKISIDDSETGMKKALQRCSCEFLEEKKGNT
jgi:hypothetical protein